VIDDTIQLPEGLDALLGHPRRLRVMPSDIGFGIAAHGPLARLRDLVATGTPVARRDGERFASPVPLPDGEYGVACYPPVFSLLPVSGDERESREEFWRSVADYHEHRTPAEQQQSARETTRWFVGEVLAPTGGRSFLEVGCGAGRNLAALAEQIPGVELQALDANPAAVAKARLTGAQAVEGSLYDLSRYPDDSVDVAYTTGVLMHVPHEEVESVVRELVRIARVAVAHAELHGDPHPFDFHRYARDYAALYRSIGLDADYQVFPAGDRRADANGAAGILIYAK